MAPDEPAAPESGDGTSGAGDARAETRSELIERLFREHNEALLRFLASKLRSAQEARDVAQEAYVRLLNMETAANVNHLRAFLFRTAANIAIDRLRARHHDIRRIDDEYSGDPPGDPMPERRLAAAQELQLLDSFLKELSPRCREAFLLRRLHGLSAQRISQQMSVPLRTVRHYIVEALVYCRVRLDEEQKKAEVGSGNPSRTE
jgi:RNA polymerase sigma-70 factor (ECF subfamily)